MKKTLASLCTLLLALQMGWVQAPAILNVSNDRPGAPIQATMWGIFFEDINFGADGGLYAEMVKNRSFEFDQPLMGWQEVKAQGATGSLLVLNEGQQRAANPRYLRVTHKGTGGSYGLSNEGFRGMGIKAGQGYDFSVWAKTPDHQPVSIKVELRIPGGGVIGSAQLMVNSQEWTKWTANLSSSATEAKAQLFLTLEAKGSVDLDMVSLFPMDTWKGRPGGLRKDLAQLLADLHPGFLRFPGGCIVEGRELATRYQWKKTVGRVEERTMIVNRWNTEFDHRPTPDYFQSFGLGFFEYFQLAEDIGAEPLPILNCGMACQFNSSEVVPTDQLDPYVQDALDLVEFANGPVTSQWGKLRADMGHPAPFNLKFLGVGNEQWGEQYVERYAIFAKAIRERYPEIRLISSVGPFPGGELFAYLTQEMTRLQAAIVDEHYYHSPEWFLKNANRYDHYPRSGPRIFAGEYAAQSDYTSSPDNRNNWRCAIAEAAFMTGLERNADLVHMASYAPLFAHTEGWQWSPDLIWFDNLSAYATPNYFVQQLYSRNKGTRVLPVAYQQAAPTGQDGLYASAVLDEKTGEPIVKIVNTTPVAKPIEIRLAQAPKHQKTGMATVTTLKSEAPDAVNTLEKPFQIAPVESKVAYQGGNLPLSLPASSFTVVRL